MDGGESKVTVDAATKLPIQIEVSYPPRIGGKSIREVTVDFVFDPILDESLFRIVPPAEYTVVRHTRGEPIAARCHFISRLARNRNRSGEVRHEHGRSRSALGEPNWCKEHRYANNFQPQPEIHGKDARQANYLVTELGYDSRGFRLTINNRSGLHSIHCFNQASMGHSVRGFQGKTREGIELGASPDDVRKAYGEPEAKMGPDDYWYAKRGWQFAFRDGKLVGYHVNRPDPALEVEVGEDGTFSMRRAK